MHADGQILCHLPVLHCFDGGRFELLAEGMELRDVVKLGPVHEASGPGKDRGDGVGGGLLALLVEPVVSGDCSMGGFGLDCSIGSVQHRSHQAQRSITYISGRSTLCN